MDNKHSVFLRAFEKDDLFLLNEWHNDENINSLTTGRKYFVSSEYDKKWIEERVLDNYNQVYCAICDNETKKMVGYTSLTKIDYINRKAFWGGLIIGDKKSRLCYFGGNTNFKIWFLRVGIK
jgi:ribosomal-protein-alanine N-acetyltransferase